MIIFEGCDKTGKSTAAKAVAARLGLEVIAFGPPKGDPFEEYSSFLKSAEKPAVLDRFHVGEFVYPFVVGREQRMTRDQFRTIDNALRDSGSLLVYLDMPTWILVDRFQADKEKFVSEQDIGIIRSMYKTYLDYVTNLRNITRANVGTRQLDEHDVELIVQNWEQREQVNPWSERRKAMVL